MEFREFRRNESDSSASELQANSLSHSTSAVHTEENSPNAAPKDEDISSSSGEDLESPKSEINNNNAIPRDFLYHLAHVATNSLHEETSPLHALTQVAFSKEEPFEIKKEGNVRIYSTKSNPNYLDVTPYLLM